jgi:hypothetical protein
MGVFKSNQEPEIMTKALKTEETLNPKKRENNTQEKTRNGLNECRIMSNVN